MTEAQPTPDLAQLGHQLIAAHYSGNFVAFQESALQVANLLGEMGDEAGKQQILKMIVAVTV